MTKQQKALLISVIVGGLLALFPFGTVVMIGVPLAIGVGLFYLIGLSAKKKPDDSDNY